MLKVAIIFLVLGFLVLLYLLMDHSKEAWVKRLDKVKTAADYFRRNVASPVSAAITSKTKEETVIKKERQFERAGLKMSYSTSLLLCFITALALFLLCWKGLDNIYLAVVAFAMGWFLPTIIIGFICNRRAAKLDEQIGRWMRMVYNRYTKSAEKSFYTAFENVLPDFVGEEPIYTELKKTQLQLSKNNETMEDALAAMASRCNNRYLRLFSKYYATASENGTETAMLNVLYQAVRQYDEHIRLQKENNRQLSELTLEAYILWGMVPIVVIYSIYTNEDYIPFMTQTSMGKIGSALILATWLIIFWVITFKLGAPLDKDE